MPEPTPTDLDAAAAFYDDAKKKAEEANKPKPVKVRTPVEVARAWKGSPLVHQPTGLARLDDLTGGGPVFGSRWYVLGAPDAGKTLLLLQLAHVLALAGVVVGFLAVDEEADDIVTRLAQRLGHFRRDCESRCDAFVGTLASELEGLGIYLYDAGETIERAGKHLAERAKERGKRSALFIDSVQAVVCDDIIAAKREPSTREIVNANVRAIRACATEHRMFVCATGEMNRAAYRSIDEAEQDDMASGKESGAIEYSARVMLALRRADDGALVAVNVVKNKHGESYVQFHLAVARPTQTLTDAPDPETKDDDDSPEFVRLCACIHQAIIDDPRMNKSGLAAALLEARVKAGGNQTKRDAALKRLVKQGKIKIVPKIEGKPNAGYVLVPIAMVVEPVATNDNANGAHVVGVDLDAHPQGSA
jgi:KaiC/GvpD/RAD55 family RecA-like ATPase